MAPSVYEGSTEEVLRKNTYTRGGYTFKGWSTTSNGEVEYQDQTKATTLTQDENNKNKFCIPMPDHLFLHGNRPSDGFGVFLF